MRRRPVEVQTPVPEFIAAAEQASERYESLRELFRDGKRLHEGAQYLGHSTKRLGASLETLRAEMRALQEEQQLRVKELSDYIAVSEPVMQVQIRGAASPQFDLHIRGERVAFDETIPLLWTAHKIYTQPVKTHLPFKHTNYLRLPAPNKDWGLTSFTFRDPDRPDENPTYSITAQKHTARLSPLTDKREEHLVLLEQLRLLHKRSPITVTYTIDTAPTLSAVDELLKGY